jgi:preprotein translocase subunit SecF
MRLFENANYDFLKARRIAVGGTAVFVALGLLAMAVQGLNESIEFTGGVLVQVEFTDPAIAIGQVREAVSAAVPGRPEVSTFGSASEFVIRARVEEGDSILGSQQAGSVVTDALAAAFGSTVFRVDRVEAIGPKVGRELRLKAMLAILLSFGATLLYITFRFEWRFGVAAVLATAHDIAATVALIGFLHTEVTLVVVAAVLTIVGYSLNDTIVVFDRVRENLRKFKRGQIRDILNRSVNETLPRTVLTGGTTLMALIALLALGGPVIRDFALLMTFGVIVGTFSSIYIASPMLLLIERRWPGEDVRGARTLVTDQPQPDAT